MDEGRSQEDVRRAWHDDGSVKTNLFYQPPPRSTMHRMPRSREHQVNAAELAQAFAAAWWAEYDRRAQPQTALALIGAQVADPETCPPSRSLAPIPIETAGAATSKARPGLAAGARAAERETKRLRMQPTRLKASRRR